MACTLPFLWGTYLRQNWLVTCLPSALLDTYCQIVLQNSCLLNLVFFLSVPEDLSLEEREELLDIRRRKKELIDDIEVKEQFLLLGKMVNQEAS